MNYKEIFQWIPESILTVVGYSLSAGFFGFCLAVVKAQEVGSDFTVAIEFGIAAGLYATLRAFSEFFKPKTTAAKKAAEAKGIVRYTVFGL